MITYTRPTSRERSTVTRWIRAPWWSLADRLNFSLERALRSGGRSLVLVLLGGTTWLSGGFWAPDGPYSWFVSPIIGLVWVVVVSRVLLTQSPATRAGW
jgi:hypothetical protein